MHRSMTSMPVLPFKSVATALIFTVILGPLGLLYSSFRGGIFMMLLGLIVMGTKLGFVILVYWICCSIWAVKAVEKYNQNLLGSSEKNEKEYNKA